MRFLDEKVNPNELSPLTLAFIGDTVYDLFVREMLICQANRPVNDLHRLAVRSVKASAQKAAAEKLMPILTEKEISVFKRGRNAKTNHIAKNASEADYHYATGFECLFGYLYLDGQSARLQELFGMIHQEQAPCDSNRIKKEV